MKKLILFLSLGTLFCASCHTEKLDNPNPPGNTEVTHKSIKQLHIEQPPRKTVYLLNEALELDGISIKVTYTDGTTTTLTSQTLPEDWQHDFSSEKPCRGKDITLRPAAPFSDVQVSFPVDVLPLVVENDILVQVVPSEYTTLRLPEGIKSINDEVFGNNTGLEEIILPGTLEKIGRHTFYGSHLKTVDLSRSTLKELPSGTFESCEQLSSVLLPKTLKKIGGNAFMGTTQLSELEIPEGVEELGNTAFSGSGIRRVRLPNTIRTIQRSFYQCSELKEVTTYGQTNPAVEAAGSIWGESFQHCRNLEILQIPGGVSRIGISVLGECKVEELVIPTQVTHIEFNAFGNATTLQKVHLQGNKKKVIEDQAFPSTLQKEVLKQNAMLADE